MTQDASYLDLPRIQMDRIVARGEIRDIREEHMSLGEHWVGQFSALGEQHEIISNPIPLRGCRLVRLPADVANLPGVALEPFDGIRGLGTD